MRVSGDGADRAGVRRVGSGRGDLQHRGQHGTGQL